MGKNKKTEIPMWAKTGHAKPVSRRDFLGAGIIPFAATILVPNWMSLILGSNAQAADGTTCPVPESLIPFVTINLAGGAAMASNFLPMNSARQPISSYSKLGLGNNQVPIEREFGNVPFAGVNNGVLISKFLQGIRQQANAATLAKTAFIGVPCDSQNDTASNRFDISGAVTRAGLAGSNLPNLGRVNTRTGIRMEAAIIAPPSPLVVNSYNALLTSIGYSATLGRNLNQTQKNSLAKLMSNLNSSQTRKLASVNGGAGVQNVLDCAGIKNVDIVEKGTSIVDPRQNANYSTVWGINANTNANNRELIFGSMIYNSLTAQAGVSSIELGGYDYHDNSRTTGDAKDLDAGVVVGRILQSASVLNRPVFIYIVSDGSVFSADSQDRAAGWQGDRGSNGVAYVLYFNPNGRPATSDFQIGHFNNNQAADPSFITGANPETAAAAVFANWCKANGRMDLFDKVTGRLFDSNQLSQVIKIA
ncbi:hypothetical protein D3C87_1049540 [compost metagenome]